MSGGGSVILGAVNTCKAAISDKPWCVSYVIGALNSFTTCLPSIVYDIYMANLRFYLN